MVSRQCWTALSPRSWHCDDPLPGLLKLVLERLRMECRGRLREVLLRRKAAQTDCNGGGWGFARPCSSSFYQYGALRKLGRPWCSSSQWLWVSWTCWASRGRAAPFQRCSHRQLILGLASSGPEWPLAGLPQLVAYALPLPRPQRKAQQDLSDDPVGVESVTSIAWRSSKDCAGMVWQKEELHSLLV